MQIRIPGFAHDLREKLTADLPGQRIELVIEVFGERFAEVCEIFG